MLYDKADGLVYRIGEPGGIFFVGGDYDGAAPTDTRGAADEFERINARRHDTRAKSTPVRCARHAPDR